MLEYWDKCQYLKKLSDKACQRCQATKATTVAQRCAAQYGQYSAPIYKNCGLPVVPTEFGGGPFTACKGFL